VQKECICASLCDSLYSYVKRSIYYICIYACIYISICILLDFHACINRHPSCIDIGT
jgi:hypothetical protein